MPAPTVNAGSFEVTLAGGRYHTAPATWANVEPFTVSVDAGEYRVYVPSSSSQGAWSSWSSAARSYYGDRASYSSVSIPSYLGASASAVTESSSVGLATFSGGVVLLQVRRAASASVGVTVTTTVSVGGVDITWDLTTGEVQGTDPWSAIQPSGNAWLVPTATGTATIDGNTYANGSAVQPGDAIVLQGGTHGAITLRNLHGTLANPILVMNENRAAQVVISRATATSGGLLLYIDDCSHVVVDGMHRYTGHLGDPTPTGHYGILITGLAQDGSVDSPTIGIKVGGLSTNIKVRGVDVDGQWGLNPAVLTGIQMGIRVGDTAVAPTVGVPLREDIIFEYLTTHECWAEGIYFGQNWDQFDTANYFNIPLDGAEVRYLIADNLGYEGVNFKSVVSGDIIAEDCVVNQTGLRVPTGTDQGRSISWIDCLGTFKIRRNKLYEGLNGFGGGCSKIRSSHGYGSTGASFEIQNNLIVRTGANHANSNKRGIQFFRNSLTPAYVSIDIRNNTLVDIGGTPTINAPTATMGCTPVIVDNIVVGTNTSITPTSASNYTGTVASADFVDAVTDDYHLDVSAPAGIIDACGAGYPATDLDGVARPQGAGADRGAYERVGG